MITLSNPHAVGGAKAGNHALLRFAGKEVTEQYLAQIRQFPDDTFRRLADIAHVSRHQGPAHIKLAKQYAVVDDNLASLNHVVTTDVSNRERNKRSNPEESAKAAEHLKDFRVAIATALAEKGYPEDGQALSETERAQLMQPPAPAPVGLVQGVINTVSWFWSGVRSLLP